jgi:hypothetical protein
MSAFSVRATAIAGAILLLAPAHQAMAWGASGHRMIGQLAAAALPEETPAFLRTPRAIQDLGELQREPDRWRGSGKTHDTTRDPAHFVDADDDGKIMGGPSLNNLPLTRSEYDAALGKVGTDSWRMGYLPYAIVDGWQQLAEDFAYWRVLKAAIPREQDPRRKAWLERDLARREALTINDLGVWSHYVGDASQPLHVTVHYNGWGAFPNPHGYTQERVHVPFESPFVRRFVTIDQVRAAMTPPRLCEDAIEICTARYLAATAATVEPFYILQKAGGFVNGDARGRAFASERLAFGASTLRDLVVTAWRASAKGKVGYPAVTVDQVVGGGVDPYEALYGDD